jgi:hypothetical protein
MHFTNFKLTKFCIQVFEKNSLIRYLDNFNEIYQEYDRLIDHEIDFGKLSYLTKKV